jgi:ATP-dependent Clp protease ATP-binding subunit ClpA
VDFRNVILIMTSNAGAADRPRPPSASAATARGRGYGRHRAHLHARIPQPSGCGDQLRALSREVILQVVEKFVLQLEAQLMDRNVHIELTPEAPKWLAEKGYDDKMGARPLAG